MNKEKFLSFLSKEMVKEEDVKNRIEEERKLYETGNGFVSQLSFEIRK